MKIVASAQRPNTRTVRPLKTIARIFLAFIEFKRPMMPKTATKAIRRDKALTPILIVTQPMENNSPVSKKGIELTP